MTRKAQRSLDKSQKADGFPFIVERSQASLLFPQRDRLFSIPPPTAMLNTPVPEAPTGGEFWTRQWSQEKAAPIKTWIASAERATPVADGNETFPLDTLRYVSAADAAPRVSASDNDALKKAVGVEPGSTNL